VGGPTWVLPLASSRSPALSPAGRGISCGRLTGEVPLPSVLLLASSRSPALSPAGRGISCGRLTRGSTAPSVLLLASSRSPAPSPAGRGILRALPSPDPPHPHPGVIPKPRALTSGARDLLRRLTRGSPAPCVLPLASARSPALSPAGRGISCAHCLRLIHPIPTLASSRSPALSPAGRGILRALPSPDPPHPHPGHPEAPRSHQRGEGSPPAGLPGKSRSVRIAPGVIPKPRALTSGARDPAAGLPGDVPPRAYCSWRHPEAPRSHQRGEGSPAAGLLGEVPLRPQTVLLNT
jgi:hypothetical protein